MKTVLSIGAHPDDIEIGCGGTEALLKAAGYRIIHVVATNGEQGGPPEQRKKEARQSGKILGANKVIFLGLPDGLTSFGLSEKMTLIKLIREYRPEIVFTHAHSDSFPDHQIVRALTDSALTVAAGPWYPAAGKKPFRVKKVYGYEVWHPMSRYQTAFDITQTIKQKLKALRYHFSQITQVDYPSAVEGLALYRGAMSMKGKFAEVFEVIYHEENL